LFKGLEFWFILSLVSAVGFGVLAVLWKVIMEELPPSVTLAYLFIFYLCFLLPYLLSSKKFAFPSKNVMLLLVVSALVGLVANLTVFKAYQLSPNPGYVRAVSSASIIVATTISIWLFKLKPDLQGILGTILIFIGLLMLAKV